MIILKETFKKMIESIKGYFLMSVCFIVPMYSYNRELNNIIKDIIKNKDDYIILENVYITRPENFLEAYSIYFYNEKKKKVYEIWIENRWYGFADICRIYNIKSLNYLPTDWFLRYNHSITGRARFNVFYRFVQLFKNKFEAFEKTDMKNLKYKLR